MKTLIICLFIMGSALNGSGYGAEKRNAPEKDSERSESPAVSARPSLEKTLNGVTLAVFYTDKDGRPTPDRAWILASNANSEPMIVSGIVAHDFQAVLVGAQKNAPGSKVTISEKFACVVGGGKQVLIWFCDTSKAAAMPLALETGQMARIRAARNVHVTEIANLEVK